MKILIGTREGMFVANGGGAPVAAEGLSGGVLTLCRTNGSVLAGTDDGIFRSKDGSSWEASGVDGKAVRAITAAPDDSYVLAGTQPASLYRSSNGGRSWVEVESLAKTEGHEEWGLPGEPDASRALAIVIDAAQPKRCWVGVEVGGIMQTNDGGETWRPLLAGENPDIHALARDPIREDVIYATTGFGRTDPGGAVTTGAGTYRSQDGGETWSYVWPDLERRYTRPMCVDTRAPHALTVASAVNFRSSYRDAGGANSMLYQSTDGGETWRSLGDSAHSPSAANLTALTPDSEESGGVLAGTDSGEVWRVNAAGEWTLLATGLPHVQALLQIDS